MKLFTNKGMLFLLVMTDLAFASGTNPSLPVPSRAAPPVPPGEPIDTHLLFLFLLALLYGFYKVIYCNTTKKNSK